LPENVCRMILINSRTQRKLNMIKVTIQTSQEIYTESFETEAQARAFAKEEVKWEGTERVTCQELGIDETGDFS